MHGLYYGLGNVGGCGWFGSDWWSRGMMIGLLLIGVTVVVLLAVHLSHRNRSNSGSLEAIGLKVPGTRLKVPGTKISNNILTLFII